MSCLKLTVGASLLFTALLPHTSVADEFYQSINDVVAHFYHPGSNKEAPWHKEGENEGITDYSLCYQKRVNSAVSQYLVVMCPDMNQSVMDNQTVPTDYYVLQQTPQGFRLLFERQNSDGFFHGVADIGADKWAIHSSASSMNQGYYQSHDLLEEFVDGKFIEVAQWTSAMNNNGAIEDDTEVEDLANKLTVDTSQETAGYYALAIHATGSRGQTKVDEKYSIPYSPVLGGYAIPDELNDGY